MAGRRSSRRAYRSTSDRFRLSSSSFSSRPLRLPRPSIVPVAASQQELARESARESAQSEAEAYVPAAGVGEAPPAGGLSRLSGFAPDGAGRDVHVIDAVGNERWTVTDGEGHFVFEQLPPGIYSVFIEGGYQEGGVELDGTADVDILFAPVIAIWETTVTNAGSMPGFSSVRVEVEGMSNLPVRIWQGEEDGVVARTGASGTLSTQSEANLVEFRGLDPGRYLIEPEGLGIWADVDITGLEALWVSFRRKTEPVGLNEVRLTPVQSPGLRLGTAATAQLAPRTGDRSVYVFVAAVPPGLDQQLALLQYVASHRPQLGNDLAEAARADVVILIEDEQAPGDVEQALLLRNVTVARAHGNWAVFFNTIGG